MKRVLGRCFYEYDYVYVLMHDILVFSTCCDDMHGMSLYDVFLPYMHSMGLVDYMMKSFLTWRRFSMLVLLTCEMHVKGSNILGLPSMCEVMGLHMYIA